MSAARLSPALLVAIAAAGAVADGPRTPHEAATTRCSVCHTTAGWERVTFDHAKTGFLLAGAHAEQACSSCHAADLSRALPQSCAGCHADGHAGEFGTRCAGCHDETSWRPLFDADAHRRTNFPLAGRHAFLPCQECHLDRRDRSFTRAAVDCVGCHRAQYDRTGAGSLDHAASGFSTACRDCHVPWSWQMARFPAHETCFQIASGPHANIRCDGCHTQVPATAPGTCNTNTASCTRCHTCSQTDRRHTEVAGYQCKDRKCYECHRFTAEGAARGRRGWKP